MNKYVTHFIIGLCLGALFGLMGATLFSGGESADAKAKSYVVKESTNVAMKHFSQKGEEVIIHQHTFVGNEQILLLGYLKEKPEEKREVLISYNKGFQVITDVHLSNNSI